MAAKTIEAKAVISAEDRTGAAFKAVVDHMHKMEEAAQHASARVQTAARMEEQTRQIAHEQRMREGLARRVEASARREEVSARREEIKHLREVQQIHKDISGRKTVMGIMGAAVAERTAHFAKHSLETYREFDKERRYAKAVMGISDEAQEPLIKQAIKGGGSSKYNDIQWLEAQRELAARGLNVDQVLGITKVAAHLGQAMDKTLPEASRLLEGGMFGFGKDISTLDKAESNARRTADLQVKASKISGMNAEDVQQSYKYGAAPFRMAGLSEEQLLAFAAVGKKANMSGEEMGVAARALAANLLKPTAGARTAMLANGVDYSKFQTLSARPMDVAPFAQSIAASYGVELSKKARSSLQKVFDDKKIVQDAGKFMPAIMKVLEGSLGGKDAKAKKSIAGEARRYRDAAMSGVDSAGLFDTLIPVIAKNPALANLIFGSKQGARIRTAIGDPDVFMHKLDELKNHSQGYAEQISNERMAGFDGAISRFEGAVKNLESALPRAFDNDGKGGLLTGATNKIGEFVQALAEAPPPLQRLATGAGVAAAAFAGFKGAEALLGGFGLKGAAKELSEAAHLLMGASGGKHGAPGAVAGAAGGAAAAEAVASGKTIPSLWGRGLSSAVNLGFAGYTAASGVEVKRDAKGNPYIEPFWGKEVDQFNDWYAKNAPWWLGGGPQGDPPKTGAALKGSRFSGPPQPMRRGNRIPTSPYGSLSGVPSALGSASPYGSLGPAAPGSQHGFQPIGAANSFTPLMAPKPQKVDVSIAPPAPLQVKIEATSSSELIRIVDQLKSATVQLKAMAATAPGGLGETSTQQ